MIAQGVKPNAVTYNTVLRGCATDNSTDMQVCLGIAFFKTVMMLQPSFRSAHLCYAGVVSC